MVYLGGDGNAVTVEYSCGGVALLTHTPPHICARRQPVGCAFCTTPQRHIRSMTLCR
jgi:hypothetical protein